MKDLKNTKKIHQGMQNWESYVLDIQELLRAVINIQQDHAASFELAAVQDILTSLPETLTVSNLTDVSELIVVVNVFLTSFLEELSEEDAALLRSQHSSDVAKICEISQSIAEKLN